MALSDWFRSSRPPASPPDLRTSLIAAAAAKDTAAFTQLFRGHRDTIREQFFDWTTVPMAMREDQAVLAQYAEMLITVARLFEQDGDRAPMEALSGDPADSPIEAWNRDIEAARQLSEAGRHADAAQALEAVLAAIGTLRGSAVDFYRPRVLGKLGIALYQAGDAARALDVTREAKALCERLGDDEGVKAYSANIETMEGR